MEIAKHFLNENFMIQKIKNLEVPSAKSLKIRGILQKKLRIDEAWSRKWFAGNLT